MQPVTEFVTDFGTPTKTCRSCREAQRNGTEARLAGVRERISKWESGEWFWPQTRAVGYLDDRNAAPICTQCPLAECVYMPTGPDISECPLPAKIRY